MSKAKTESRKPKTEGKPKAENRKLRSEVQLVGGVVSGWAVECGSKLHALHTPGAAANARKILKVRELCGLLPCKEGEGMEKQAM